MYRIDDPIGSRVDGLEAQIGGQRLKIDVENVALAPGGHVDYWRERAVCTKLWSLVRRGAAPTASAVRSLDPEGGAMAAELAAGTARATDAGGAAAGDSGLPTAPAETGSGRA
jgi:hypothetical protein